MLAVGLGVREVAPYIENHQGKVVVACHNSPESVTLSGDFDAMDVILGSLQANEIFAREVRTSGKAYHSHHMASAASEYREALGNLLSTKNVLPQEERQCRMISTVTGEFIGADDLDYSYWAANLERPVLFNQAVTRIAKDNPDAHLLVEVGPHPALSGPIRQVFKHADKPVSYIPTLKRDHDDVEQLLRLAGELWTIGFMIDMTSVTNIERPLADESVEEVSGSLLVDLPPYQWNYARKYYQEPRQSREHRTCRHPRHDLLGRRLPGLSPANPQWRNILRLEDVPWLKDHIVRHCHLYHRIIG